MYGSTSSLLLTRPLRSVQNCSRIIGTRVIIIIVTMSIILCDHLVLMRLSPTRWPFARSMLSHGSHDTVTNLHTIISLTLYHEENSAKVFKHNINSIFYCAIRTSEIQNYTKRRLHRDNQSFDSPKKSARIINISLVIPDCDAY